MVVKNLYNEEFKVGMYFSPPAEYDNTRPSKHRVKIKSIKVLTPSYLSTITGDDNHRYTVYRCYNPSFKS